ALSPVASSTGATPGRTNARKAATPASPSPLAGTAVAAGVQTQARQRDIAARPSRHKSDGRNAPGAPIVADENGASATAGPANRAGSSLKALPPAGAGRRPLIRISLWLRTAAIEKALA